MTTQQTLPVLTNLKLTDQVRQIVNGALARARPISLAYVDAGGRPSLSFRGSTQAYDDTRLAIWVRNPHDGIVGAMERNPNVTLLYGDLDPEARAFITFRGRARFEQDETTRRSVYDNAPEPERNLDKDRKGAALLIELDSVDGIVPGYMLKMRR
jgi:Pyridoxamine 5'-phosphate oxidase